MIKNFIKLDTQDPILSKLQDSLDNIFKSIGISKIIDGNLIKNISFNGDGDTYISHGLGRKYEGWIIVDQDSFCTFVRSPTVNNKKDTVLILIAGTACIGSVWVF